MAIARVWRPRRPWRWEPFGTRASAAPTPTPTQMSATVTIAHLPAAGLSAGHWLLSPSQRDHQPPRDTTRGDVKAEPPPMLGGVSAPEFEPFVRQHERQLLNFLWRMTGDEQTAYDLTQETFLRAWQHYATITTYQQPRAWLFRVATNLAINQQRRKSGPVGRATSLEGSAEPGMSDPARHLIEGDAVRWALLRLSPKLRAVLVLREVYDLSALEVGQALGMKQGAVKMALWRAREQFRAIYLGEEESR